MEKKFKALRTISIIFKIIAWIIAVFTIIGFIVMLVGGAALSQFGSRYGSQAPAMFGPLWGIFMAFYILIVGAISFISFLAAAEMILVILAIEENTRALRQTPPAQ
ncbi:MAG TPA: hypothetical protein ENI34_06175 [candidate division WOR-3 bacterium]|uniref:DUF4282 domain-containing protein n=1 Tax=candidate division WOR-3 bacterium TaxID=2052148 RepID=A0A9C9EN37_UNCW3|nr:hypothetical protein [candidate division WOR-3 bacterium]